MNAHTRIEIPESTRNELAAAFMNSLAFERRISGSIFSRDPLGDGKREMVDLLDVLAQMSGAIKKLPKGAERDQLLALNESAAALTGEIKTTLQETHDAVSESAAGLRSIAELLDKTEGAMVRAENLCSLISPVTRQICQSEDLMRGMLG